MKQYRRGYPTIRQTCQLIRDMGLRAVYVPEYEEFQVSYHGKVESTYYTQSRHDALFTARAMSESK